MAAAAVSASSSRVLVLSFALLAAAVSSLAGTAAALSTGYYNKRCPSLQPAVRSAMARAVAADPNTGAAVLRLFFHDCFVNGCDASVLLDGPAGEKAAAPNANSLRGYEAIDSVKSQVEAACPGGVVSCADVLALTARDAVSLLGGPSWTVRLGRRDARAASRDAANANLPGPGSGLPALVAAFAAKGLSPRDMTALSGAHTVGRARCATFRGRVNGGGEAINATYAAGLRGACPAGGGADGALAPLDAETPDAFDNGYFRALVQRRGLLHSDQELYNGGSQDALVRKYASNGPAFAGDFGRAMVRMGNLAPAPGTPLEVRVNCRRPN
ncbi:unnamed protein product [Urochloa decumbens]|uniref:Peroxidase n=1 Tax=Urochloa decumbens TaxID=240449 RepID=A0ABC9CMS6_9POAL